MIRLRKPLLVSLICVLGIGSTIAGLPFDLPTAAAASPAPVTIAVQNSVKDTITEGVGWNAEKIWGNFIEGLHPISDAGFEKYNHLVSYLKPQVVRFGVNLPYWSPSYGSYTYDSTFMQSNYKQLDAFKEMGTNIIWANWWASSAKPDNYWWSEVTRNGGTDPDNNPRNDRPYNTVHFTEGVADAVQYLRDTKGYTNIKYVSLWNEPNWNFVSPTANYPLSASSGTNTFWPMYSELDTALSNKGVRSGVGIVGPENSDYNFTNNISTYVQNPVSGTQQFGQVADQISVHDYDTFFDYDTRDFAGSSNYISLQSYINLLNNVRTSVNNTYASNGKSAPPFFLGEIGNSGYGANYVNDASAAADGSLYQAEETIRLLAEGYDGIMRWNLTYLEWGEDGTDPMNSAFKPIDYVYTDGSFKVRGAAYYSSAVLSRYMTRGSQVYNFTKNGDDNPGRVFAAPLKGTDGKWTIFLVNDDFVERQVDLDLTALGLANGTNFYEFDWSAGNPQGIHASQMLSYQGRNFNIPLQPRSIMAFTMRGDNEFIPGAMLTVDAKPVAGTIANNGFENGIIDPWNPVSNIAIQKSTVGAAHSGNFFATLNTSIGDGVLKQTVGNLKPGKYTLTAYGKTEGGSHPVRVAVNINGTEVGADSTTNATWTKMTVPFTVPVGGGTIEVAATSPYKAGSTWANLDDFGIAPEFVTQAGFESGSTSGWTTTGSIAVENSPVWSNTGSYLVTLNTSQGTSEISQTVSGLQPGNYVLRSHLRTSGSNTAYLGVRNFDGPKDYSQDVNSSDYRTASVYFTIPSGGSSATIYLTGPGGGSGSFVNADDFEIVPVSELLNGGFEGESPLHWSGSGSVARQAVSGAHSGSALATINTSLGGGSFSQTIAGLAPGTYSFSGYVRSGGGVTGTIRASGYGGTAVSASTSNSYWTRLKVEFTIPNGSNSVTVTFEAPSGGAGTYCNGDDFEMRIAG